MITVGITTPIPSADRFLVLSVDTPQRAIMAVAPDGIEKSGYTDVRATPRGHKAWAVEASPAQREPLDDGFYYVV